MTLMPCFKFKFNKIPISHLEAEMPFGLVLPVLNPNWHEAGRIYPLYNLRIGFCQLNFYQKFSNIVGGEN